MANNCRVSLFKGAPVSVTGKLVTKTWSEEGVDETGKPVTQTRSKIMLKATQVSFDLSNYQVLHSARALREELQAQSADDLVAGQDGPAFAETRISAEDVVTFDDVKEDAAAPF